MNTKYLKRNTYKELLLQSILAMVKIKTLTAKKDLSK